MASEKGKTPAGAVPVFYVKTRRNNKENVRKANLQSINKRRAFCEKPACLFCLQNGVPQYVV